MDEPKELREDLGRVSGFTILWKYWSHVAEFRVFEIITEVWERGQSTDGPGRLEYTRAGAIDSMDTVADVEAAENYVNGMIKWDACSHFYFGDPKNSGYLHLCGATSLRRHHDLIEYLHRRAFELMGRAPDDEEAWTDEKAYPFTEVDQAGAGEES